MTRTICEADWKVFRALHPIAMERFSARVLAEIDRILADTGRSAHARYLAVAKLVDRRDRELSEMFDDLRRSTALIQLARLRFCDLVTNEEFVQFGEETRGVIAMFQDK